MKEKRACSPQPPPSFPGTGNRDLSILLTHYSYHWRAEGAGSLYDRQFTEGYRADVCIYTNNGIIPAHASILGMASPVMKSMLRQPKSRGCSWKAIPTGGVPDHAVWVFLRFLYSSCYEQEHMHQYAIHLLVLSHAFVIPSLKKICIQKLEKGLLTAENIVDVFQLALLCDAPHLRLICHRLIVENFKAVSATDGWRVMKKSSPRLEKELLEAVVDADLRKKDSK